MRRTLRGYDRWKTTPPTPGHWSATLTVYVDDSADPVEWQYMLDVFCDGSRETALEFVEHRRLSWLELRRRAPDLNNCPAEQIDIVVQPA